MVSHAPHFLDLGFRANTEDEVNGILRDAVVHGRSRLTSGKYLVWNVGSGIEIWAVPNSRGASATGFPRFLGESLFVVEIEERVTSSMSQEDEILVRCRTHPPKDRDDYSDNPVPVLIDFVHVDLTTLAVEPSAMVQVHVTAFAEGMSCFETEEDHQMSQETEIPPPVDETALSPIELAHHRIDRMTRSPKSYFPFGQFKSPPTSEVGFAGHVRRLVQETNPLTGIGFHHLVVETYGGMVLDVVASPSLTEGRPVEGGIVEGDFCLGGRLSERVRITTTLAGAEK